MRCIITAGPTYEPLDSVRRLTNLSTGRLGSELAEFLASRGHEVVLLLGEQATFRIEPRGYKRHTFTTTASLADRLESLASQPYGTVFHAAAVSDFGFGKIWARSNDGTQKEIKAGKLSTRDGTLLAELVPTPKIIGQLRSWFPKGLLVGWKFEVEGDRTTVIDLACKQTAECHTDACVANGPAYGEGFGLVTSNKQCTHLHDRVSLFSALEKLLQRFPYR